jgi:DNA-binding NarL/FixJ family response regulator
LQIDLLFNATTKKVLMERAESISVLIAEDHPIMRRGLADEINSQPDMHVVAEAATGLEATELYFKHRPTVAVLDLRMPGRDGIEVISEVRLRFPQARTIVLTTALGDVQIVRAFRAGASSYLLKSMVRSELTDTIRTVARGKKRIPQEIAAQMAEHALDDDLSNREVDVLRHASNGNSNKMIADQLALSEHTIKTHFKNILSKLRANDRTHAVSIATKRGFLDRE